MIVPNKIVPFKESVLGKIAYILKVLTNGSESVEAIYLKTQQHFEDVNQYILGLDVLYVLGAIEFIKEEMVIKYVKTNNM